MITYYQSYYWLVRLRYFATYTISLSPWTYPSSGRDSLAVVAVHLLKLCCSLCCSPEYLQHAFFILICKSRRRISCNMRYVIDSHRSIELRMERSPRFRVRPAQYWIIRSDCKMEHSPLPAAVHAWEQTCHCSYVIFTSNTDEIVIKNIAVICHYHFRRTFCYNFVNTDTCAKNMATYYCSFIIWAYGFLRGYIGWHS